MPATLSNRYSVPAVVDAVVTTATKSGDEEETVLGTKQGLPKTLPEPTAADHRSVPFTPCAANRVVEVTANTRSTVPWVPEMTVPVVLPVRVAFHLVW